MFRVSASGVCSRFVGMSAKVRALVEFDSAVFDDADQFTLGTAIEGGLAGVFQVEFDRVDVRYVPFSEYDDRSHPLFVHVEVLGGSGMFGLFAASAYAEAVEITLAEILRAIGPRIPFRVWVTSVDGAARDHIPSEEDE